MRVLSVDCGGGGIKAAVFDDGPVSDAVRVPVAYPMSPDCFVATIARIAGDLPAAERVSVGMPGVIRHGIVTHTPHYITFAGPHSQVNPSLLRAWKDFDARAALTERLGVPTLVVNDAQLHGAGVITGAGLELVITLGTGLGAAFYDNGAAAPHYEMSHAPVTADLTIDGYIGEYARQALGCDIEWSGRVQQVVERLFPVIWWDRIFVGGGNATRLKPTPEEWAANVSVERPGLIIASPETIVVPNAAALEGGARLWA